MPVNLSIKSVPDEIAARLRARAAANHRSLQRELMAIIEIAGLMPDAFSANGERMNVASRGQRQAGKRLRPIEEIAEDWRKVFPHPTGGPSSTEIIRVMRDGRYGATPDQPRKRPHSR
jgi:plasmid stability protein